MQLLGSVESLVAAIRDEVAAEVERLEASNARDLERVSAASATPVGEAPGAETMRSLARREARELLARADALDRRAALEERERWVERALAGARAKLQTAPADERQAGIRRRVEEALARLPGEAFDLLVRPEDAALFQHGATEADPRIAHVVADASLPEGACVVRSADGRIAYDNGDDARLRRFEGAWRRALGELYER